MKTEHIESFSVKQVKAIVKYQTYLQQKTNENVNFAEALMHWLALGYGEDYRNRAFMGEH